MISEQSCDWSNDAENSCFEITGINYILKYIIQIENSYFKLVNTFHNVNAFAVFRIK